MLGMNDQHYLLIKFYWPIQTRHMPEIRPESSHTAQRSAYSLEKHCAEKRDTYLVDPFNTV